VGALRCFALAAALLLLAAPAAATPVDRWSGFIAEASQRFGVPEDWIRRVMAAESGGRTMLDGRPIVSRAGAMGLMQLMPGTWDEMRARLALGTDPHDPRDNILAGTLYLREMHDRFGYPGLFAAYHAGPSRYARHLETGRPLPAETRVYVARLSGEGVRRAAGPAMAPARSPLFVALSAARRTESEPGELQPPADSLFVRLSDWALGE
jgi:soluble lytic murein transglycosylase-like protein